MPDNDILEDADAIEAAFRERCRTSFDAFIRGLVIAGGRGPRIFDTVMAPFQRETFADLGPNLEALRDGRMPEKRRFWIERTKKAGKDSDLAACMLWMIAFPTRPMYMQVAAADRDQAGIVKRRIQDLLYYNPWLNDHVEVVQYQVRTKGSRQAVMDILSAKDGGSHGATPDMLIVNELSHIQKWGFVENLMDNADGVPQGIVAIATNAGYTGTKPEVWRNNALKSWCCHILSKPAPWHSEETIRDALVRGGRPRWNRLWQGKWSAGKGDALSEADIERCFPEGAEPHLEPKPGLIYIAGLDLGVTNDHCGVVILGLDFKRQRMRVAMYRGFEPLQRTGEVDLMAVEDWCYQVSRHYRVTWFGYDPYQAVLMSQRLRSKGVNMAPVTFQGKNLGDMAVALVSSVEAGIIEAYDDQEGRLRRDLLKMTISEKPYGYKLESTRDEFGHADVGTALMICMPKAVEMLGGKIGWQPTDNLGAEPGEGEFTPEEAKALPEELADIYNMDYKGVGRHDSVKPVSGVVVDIYE